MEKYQEGTVFELYENDATKYIVLKKVELDGNVYLLISELHGAKNNYGIDPKKLILIHVDKDTDEITFENNKEIIRQVVDVISSN